MKARDKAKLQRLIDRAAKATTQANAALGELGRFELQYWGFEHGDQNIDEIVDGVCGGCGASDGMDADYFISLMDSCR